MDGSKGSAAIAFEYAFIAELERRIPKAKPVVATIAVGNPHESQFPLLVPLAREVARVGGAFGYHAYWPVDHGVSYLTHQWRWHAGRFAEMDDLFRREGIAIDWILSEGGPCGWNAATNEYNPAAGWRDPACFNGDFEATLEDTLVYDGLLRTSPARVLGATWFTIYGQGWEHFNLNAQQLARLAQELTR